MSDSKPQKNPIEIRKKVLADPNTAKIAKTLNVPLEEYVEGVVHFAMNPDELPEYVVASDDTIKETFGIDPAPNTEQILKIFDENLKFATLNEANEFEQKKKKLVDLPDGAPNAAQGSQDPRLKAELDKEMARKKGGKL
jgi:DNA-directed RNA polymerase specialized sigma subunit